MRPNKFRAWDERNNEMVYSDETPCFYINTKGVLFMYATPNSESGLETLYHKSYDVDLFTGKTDKNGVDIYEKDIIRTYHFTDRVTRKDEYLYHVVTWSERFHGWFMLSCSSMDENDGSIQLFVHLRANKSIEVHSNIHQSPELMESK